MNEKSKTFGFVKGMWIGILSGCVGFIRFPYNILRMIFWEFTSDSDNLTFNYKQYQKKQVI